MAESKPIFEVIRTNPAIKIGNNNYFMSIQKIIDENSNFSSEHFVLKKQGVNVDGSLRGQTRQIFIPMSDALDLLKSAVEFVS